MASVLPPILQNSPARGPVLPVVQPAATDHLADRLRAETSAEVLFDPTTRALYASDLSHYRQVPIGVVIPRTFDDVIRTIALCREFDVPILSRGTATSLAGQTCNVAVVLDFSKHLNQLLELNPRKKFAWVEPGLINDQLRSAAEQHDLTFAPDPATHAYCTVGGMIGNNSCGPHSVLGGKTSENIEELDILLYDGTRLTVGPTTERELKKIIAAGGRRGEIYRALRDLRDRYADDIRSTYPQIPRRVSGFNLDYLLPENGFHVARALVGSESTCVTVLRAKTRLIHSPQHRVLLLVAYPDVFTAADQTAVINKLQPIAIEGFQRKVIDNARLAGKHLPGLDLYPEGDAWLLVEFGADSEADVLKIGQRAEQNLRKHDPDLLNLRLLVHPQEQKHAMEVREAGLGVSRVPGKTPDTWDGWEDAAVDPKYLGKYLRDFYALCDRFGYFVVLWGHFGQGCVHCRMNFNFRTPEAVAHYRAFVTEAAHLVVKYGGSLSGEHGDGQARAELLPIMFGPRLIEAFREFKSIWDPSNRMNPGKVVDPIPLDSNLRVGPSYQPLALPTIFQFPDDDGSLARATERCFGVGKCRKLDGGTMCPSFHVTRDERHTTRGRARLLFEMLRGDSVPDTWQNEGVKEALDLCLACKGCKGDCPVSVDVATYKAEFLAHYYEGKRRPATAYSMGLIDKWARIGSRVPALANLATQTPIIRSVAKKIAGVTQHRTMPAFPAQSFKQAVRNRPPRLGHTRGEVILWADTFNNFFMPHTAHAALEVLEHAGFRVRVPQQHLCCGRPLYDFGMLEEAKQYLRTVMSTLAADIAAGTPIVCLEPSCASVFRDELRNLFPTDPVALKLQQQVVLFANFLEQHNYRPPTLQLATNGRSFRPERNKKSSSSRPQASQREAEVERPLSSPPSSNPKHPQQTTAANQPEETPSRNKTSPGEDASGSERPIYGKPNPENPAPLDVSAGDLTPSPNAPKALVHGHCHHKALWSMSPEEKQILRAGVAPEILDSGCCGLAGSFGYAAEHHETSMQIGNKVLLPILRKAPLDTLLVADGFSCRQQIAHGTRRRALHTAELLQLALHSQTKPVPTSRRVPIERGHTEPQPRSLLLPLLAAAGIAALVLFRRRPASAD